MATSPSLAIPTTQISLTPPFIRIGTRNCLAPHPDDLRFPNYIGSSRGRRIIIRRSSKFGAVVRVSAASSDDAYMPQELLLPTGVVPNKPRRIALFVEPSPFAYVSGYKNVFQNFIKYLREMGDEVIVVTTHEGAPDEFHGAKVIPSWRWNHSLEGYPPHVLKFKVVGAVIIAKLLSVPLVLSYHTHLPLYIPKYSFSWLVKPMWMIIRLLHRAADLTLVTSNVLGKELQAAGVAAGYKIRLWEKAVDSEGFNPCFKSQMMRMRLTDGEVERPLILHVGRLGAEKNLDSLLLVMERIPEARIAFVGDGPYRQELEKMFNGMPAVFTGMLHGKELSEAYASSDVFITPSESETLGLVVLEAMASGVPVVAAGAGGILDIIPSCQQGRTGFLYKPGHINDCVAILKTLLSSSQLRRQIGAAARLEAEKHDWRENTRHVRNVQYDAAIWFWRRAQKPLSRRVEWILRWLLVKRN